MQRPEPILSFQSPEGEYKCRDQLQYDLSPNTFIGTTISLVGLLGIGGEASAVAGASGAGDVAADPAQFAQLQKFGASLSGKTNAGQPTAGSVAVRFQDVPIQSDPGSGGEKGTSDVLR
jgi:hypothetical protein